MKKRLIALFVAGGLAIGCLGGAAAAGPILDDAFGRYPGAIRGASESIGLDMLREGTLNRQAVFLTDDELLAVRDWYARRLQVHPASTMNLTGGDCSLMAQSDVFFRLGHTVEVVLCAIPNGTRVVVNEKLVLWQ